MNVPILADTILRTVQNIENELKDLNESGVYFAPELYTAFEIGKNIYKNRSEIFGTVNVKWHREFHTKDVGLVDIVFSVDEKDYTAIEVKLVDTIYAYEKDITKLEKLPANFKHKFFCVMLDTFNDNDGRLKKLSENKLELLSSRHFQTKSMHYKSPVQCRVNLYAVR